MYVTPEQIQAAGKANVEALLAVANAQFAAFEKLANLKIREALRSANCLPEEVVLLNEVAALESQADARAVRTRL